MVETTPESVSKGRGVVTKEYIQKWFVELKEFLEEKKAMDIFDDPSRIFNADEAGFSLCPDSGKVLGPKGWKNIYQVKMGNEKETLTVLLTFAANGAIAPPMIV